MPKNDKKKKQAFLTDNEYCHVINKLTGKTRLVEGPCRFGAVFGLFNEIIVKNKKIIIKEGEYAVIVNPYDKDKKKQSFGARDIRIGPRLFSLHVGEELESTIKQIHVLERGKALQVKAISDFTDGKIDRKAGDEWLICGPARYIPDKNVAIIGNIDEITLPEHTGIYIKDKMTGEIRLERGKKSIMIQPHEEIYQKSYTNSEIQAIWEKNAGFDKSSAQPLWVLDNEAALIMSETSQHVVLGPKVILLEPFERPYIMTISGGTPKGKVMLKVWKIKLGPLFSTDVIEVRTRDNASLQIKLRYKWRFDFNRDDKESQLKLFTVPDFIGLATETMASIIRDEAAKQDFDALHSSATSIVKKSVFNTDEEGKGEFKFKENGFTIFDIDIKEVTPKDPKIADQMNDAIKSNMSIYVNKMKLQAEIETEKVKIESSKALEKNRTELLDLEQQNAMKKKRGEVDVQTMAIQETAKAEAEAIKVKRMAELIADADAMKKLMETLKDGWPEHYIELQRIKAMSSITRMIVPANSNMIMPIDAIAGNYTKKDGK
jgi:major vault protein